MHDEVLDHGRRITWVPMVGVFAVGVLLSTVVAAIRLFGIGLSNSAFFGHAPANPVDPSQDLTLWVTAVILAAALVLLAAMAVFEMAHKRFPVAGVVLLIVGTVPMILNWYVITY